MKLLRIASKFSDFVIFCGLLRIYELYFPIIFKRGQDQARKSKQQKQNASESSIDLHRFDELMISPLRLINLPRLTSYYADGRVTYQTSCAQAAACRDRDLKLIIRSEIVWIKQDLLWAINGL